MGIVITVAGAPCNQVSALACVLFSDCCFLLIGVSVGMIRA